jgi:hypothetical protein
MTEQELKHFENCPNYSRYELSEEQIIIIAKKAVESARNDFYKEVGETIVTKFFWLVGIVAVGLFAWLQSHNIIKL